MLTWCRIEQECGDHPNDVGSSPSDLKMLFADCELSAELQAPLDSLCEGWTDTTGVNAATSKAWAERFERFTEWVLARSETRLVVRVRYQKGVAFQGLFISSFLFSTRALFFSVCNTV